jgi:hypothetical protein
MAAPLYVPGRRVNCTADEVAAEYFSRGWYAPEPDKTWIEGVEGRLSFSIRRPQNSYVFVCDVSTFVPAGVQSLEIFFNYFRLDYFEFNERTEFAVEIPAELFTLRDCVLSLHCERAMHGWEVNVDDGRRLGVAVHSWMLS